MARSCSAGGVSGWWRAGTDTEYAEVTCRVKYFEGQSGYGRARKSLRHQYNLADVLSRFDVSVSVGDLIEREAAIDVRSYPTFRQAAHDLAHPTGDLLALAPHVTEIQTEDGFVAIHQTDWIKARHSQNRF